ncbi:hypothetical protein CONLIGDRAFT_685707 [Coniochaeta ligniaria NRRL 30616]|uniref:Uncharacterized protein n=1 Tax=Coniochaeta ligniaria NRRL 30616 TaxID=1408157 RepID=A0A1J7IUH3_9PEZI|nr:hypothetical protein CONLIGDRAFT_685707 [Coniochaeta ligniaria NRRL 30616]
MPWKAPDTSYLKAFRLRFHTVPVLDDTIIHTDGSSAPKRECQNTALLQMMRTSLDQATAKGGKTPVLVLLEPSTGMSSRNMTYASASTSARSPGQRQVHRSRVRSTSRTARTTRRPSRRRVDRFLRLAGFSFCAQPLVRDYHSDIMAPRHHLHGCLLSVRKALPGNHTRLPSAPSPSPFSALSALPSPAY